MFSDSKLRIAGHDIYVRLTVNIIELFNYVDPTLAQCWEVRR